MQRSNFYIKADICRFEAQSSKARKNVINSESKVGASWGRTATTYDCQQGQLLFIGSIFRDIASNNRFAFVKMPPVLHANGALMLLVLDLHMQLSNRPTSVTPTRSFFLRQSLHQIGGKAKIQLPMHH